MTPAGRAHGVVVSVDGRGQVTEHYRLRGAPGGEVTVPEAYVLDDAPDFEVFHFIASVEPLEVDDLMDALRARGAVRTLPPLAEGVDAVWVVLHKAPR